MKILRWCAVLIVAMVSAAQPVHALDPARALTQYQNDHWQTDQGLPQNTVQAMTQTRDGYLWVGTLDGLARFDGADFTVFDAREHAELGSGSILALMQDADGNLWIGRAGAAVIFRDRKFRVAFSDEVTAGTSVWSFCQGPDGAVWAATNNGLVRWQGGAARVFHTADGLPTEKLRSVAFDTAGTLWIGTTGGGLVSYAGGHFRAFDPSNGFPHAEVRSVIADPVGGIWAATAGGGLAHVVGDTITKYTVADGLPSNQLSALARDAQGTLWIGTWGAGISRMTKGHVFSTLSSSGGLAADQIWSLYGDREGSVWVGTWVGGLNRLRDRRFQVFGVPEGLSHDNTRAVLTARDGATWVATAGGGVNRIVGDAVTTYRIKDGLPGDEASSLWEDPDGAMWIGTNTAGLARLSRGRITAFGLAQGLPGLDVRAILRDRRGTLWVSTMSGLVQFDGRRFVTVRAPGVPLDAVVTMLEDRAGTLWFGTSGNGLIQWRDGAFRVLTIKDGLASNKVLSLHEGVRGSLWIGTGAGITRLRDGRLVSIRVANGLWDGLAQTLLEDHLGYLWVTCNRGFFRVPMQELDGFADGTLKQVTSVSFGASEAMRSTTFAGGQSPSGAVDAQGLLWLPSYKGLVVVDPSQIPAAVVAPSARIEEIAVNGAKGPAASSVVLPPGRPTLTIHYTAATLSESKRVQFRWRMDGLPGEWQEVGTQHDAFIPNLAYGAYRFHIQASFDGQDWSESTPPISVNVQSYVYETTWFLVLMTVSVGVLVIGGIRWRLRQHRRREAELQARVNSALADVHVLQGMLPICAWCKKIRNDGGYWEQIEVYVRDHSAATFTHGICPECVNAFHNDKSEKPDAE